MASLDETLARRLLWTVDVLEGGRWGFVGSAVTLRGLLELVAVTPQDLPVRVSLGSRGTTLAAAALDGSMGRRIRPDLRRKGQKR